MDTMDYHSAIKKKNFAICSNMDEPGLSENQSDKDK